MAVPDFQTLIPVAILEFSDGVDASNQDARGSI
jgi:hypothetical protein